MSVRPRRIASERSVLSTYLTQPTMASTPSATSGHVIHRGAGAVSANANQSGQ
jgi:hypothetical protein